MTSHDIERIAKSVLRDYGVQLRLHEVARQTDSWEIVLHGRDKSPLHIAVTATSPHEIRRALMSALRLDG